ncbi:MAG: hypothetical protein ACI308_10265 [Muribaculaceae bacterium]
MKRLFLSIAIMCAASFFAANAEIVKFGTKPTDAEMNMTVYAPDSTAAAVILTDAANAFYQYSNNDGFLH